MKALIRILFSASIQKTPDGDTGRARTPGEAKTQKGRTPTMLFPMALTLEGYHVCGGPVFE
ncbi:MAG TPA: hypothetical protein VE242_13660 [Chthoniobacterales bacterium]|nr:hypothetical protein [Chthoniobacterales bacterium]